MKITRSVWAVAAIVLSAGQVVGQGTPNSPPAATPERPTAPWSFSLITDGYVVPHSQFYLSPTFTADREWLHLEARYNYEDQETASFWVGYNFSLGQQWVLEATPMVGGAVGNTTGIAPGYRASFHHKRLEQLELSTQGEYLFDTKDSAGSFFYSWLELTYSPAEWFHTGIAAQKTKAYHTDLNVQRGLLVGFSHKQIEFTTYIFNAGWTEPTLVFEIGASF